MAALRAVVFDLFHTLAFPDDFRPPDFDRLGRAAAIFGVGEDELRSYWFDEVVPIVVGRPDRPADLLARFAVARGGRDGDAARAAVDDAIGRYQDAALLRPRASVLAALAAVRSAGLATGLLSNAHERDVREWDGSPLSGYFDTALISCFAGLVKPEPAAYRSVLASLGVDAAQAMFVGDGGSEEFRGARAVGFASVVCVSGPPVASGFRTAAEMEAIAVDADVRIAEIGELAGVIAVSRP